MTVRPLNLALGKPYWEAVETNKAFVRFSSVEGVRIQEYLGRFASRILAERALDLWRIHFESSDNTLQRDKHLFHANYSPEQRGWIRGLWDRTDYDGTVMPLPEHAACMCVRHMCTT
jgi:hypothetical protein